MRSYNHIIISILLITICVSWKNTTNFWSSQLNRTNLGFHTYSGYHEIDWYYPKGRSNMFYNLFGAYGHNVMQNTTTVPLVIWLQGGPGFNSQFGAFTEIGPIRIEKGVPKILDYSWNIFGNLLFIDSPLDVGFSYQWEKRIVTSTNEATNHLMNFLFHFFNQFKNLAGCPVYIAGQSYAGHYIPNLARKILTNTTFTKATGINLAGISIGNGWVDPVNQLNFVDSHLWSAAIVDSKFRDVLTWHQTQSIVNIFQGKYTNATNYFNYIFKNPNTARDYMGNVSIYNFRDYVGADHSYAAFMEKYKAQFGVAPRQQFYEENKEVYDGFSADITRSFAQDLATCLRNIKVLIYNGQNDIIVNNAGVLTYLNSLQWQGINAWRQNRKRIWTRFGEVKGWVKAEGNLWFVMVNGAGHMVPTDQPQSAFIMFGHFISNQHDWNQ